MRINCFSSVIIDANILPVEIDSIVSTFCADQDTLIQDFDGQMILFNKDNPSATFSLKSMQMAAQKVRSLR